MSPSLDRTKNAAPQGVAHQSDSGTTKPIPAEAAPEWRECEFCGCNTNAKLRRCCDKGTEADKA